MFYFCYEIRGKRTYFPVATVVDTTLVKRPGPGPINIPQFELAVTTIDLVNRFEGTTHSVLGKKLLEASRAVIEEVKASLPKGVEITEYHPQEQEIAA